MEGKSFGRVLPCARCGRDPSPDDDQGDWYAVRVDGGALALACPECEGMTVEDGRPTADR